MGRDRSPVGHALQPSTTLLAARHHWSPGETPRAGAQLDPAHPDPSFPCPDSRRPSTALDRTMPLGGPRPGTDDSLAFHSRGGSHARILHPPPPPPPPPGAGRRSGLPSVSGVPWPVIASICGDERIAPLCGLQATNREHDLDVRRRPVAGRSARTPAAPTRESRPRVREPSDSGTYRPREGKLTRIVIELRHRGGSPLAVLPTRLPTRPAPAPRRRDRRRESRVPG